MKNLSAFKTYLIKEKSALNTIESYYKQMEFFFKKYDAFTQENVNNYVLERKNTVAPSTYNLGRAAMKEYVCFLNSDISIGKRKKVTKKISDSTQYVTEQEFLWLFKLIPRLSENAIKYRAILSILFYCGLRASELCDLKKDNINFEEKTLKLRDTKNAEERLVVMTDSVVKYLKRYLDYQPIKEGEPIFNMNPDALTNSLRAFGKQVNKKLYTHMFRHSCAKYWIKNGMSQGDLQILLGHSDPTMTAYYASSSIEEYQENFKKLKQTDF